MKQQTPTKTAWLDVSGELTPPTPSEISGTQCDLCHWPAARLFTLPRHLTETGKANNTVCTHCWLCFNLDTPSAAGGALSWLDGMASTDVIHLQRMALIASIAGDNAQKKHGKAVLKWLLRHKKEVQQYWKTVRPAEFATAMTRQHPEERLSFRHRLAGTHLIMTTASFTDITLLLPAKMTAEEVLKTLTLPAVK